MPNSVNTIHYAVDIKLKDSTQTLEDIGLYEGSFRFTTDGYIPLNAVYEDNTEVPLPYKWFTNFLVQNSIKGVGSSISLDMGGDYAYIKNSSITIINQTINGSRFHKELNNNNIILVGSVMTIYVVLDDVFYTRWTGLVSSITLDDHTLVFNGTDLHYNSNDILENVKLGVIVGGEFDYKCVEDTPYESNIILRRFGPFVEGIQHIHADINAIGGGGHVKSNGTFTGITNKTICDIEPMGNKWLQIKYSFEAKQWVDNNVDIGDYIQVNNEDNYYEILDILIDDFGEDNIRFFVKYIDQSLESYVAWFGDGNLYATGSEVAEELSTLSDSKGLLSFYKKAKGTGIPSEWVTGDYVTILDSDGNKIKMTYTVLEDGTIRLDKEVFTSLISPKKISYMKEGFSISDISSSLYNYVLDDTKFRDISLPNQFNPSDAYIDIGNTDEGFGHKTVLFKLEFDENIDNLSDYNLSVLMSGIYNNDTQNHRFSAEYEHLGIDWCICWEKDLWSDGTTAPNKTIVFGDPEIWAGSRSNYFKINYFKIATYWNKDGKKKILIPMSEMNLPNAIKANSVSYNNSIKYDKISTNITSVPVTNAKLDDNTIISTGSGCRYLQPTPDANNIAQWVPGGILDNEEIIVDNKEIIVGISCWDISPTIAYEPVENSGKQYRLSTNANSGITYNVFDSDPEIQLRYPAIKINSIGLIKTEELTEKKNVVKLLTNNISTTQYPNFLTSLHKSGTTIDISNVTNRDNWMCGLYLKNATPRFDIITDLCKQSMVAGYSNRFGIPTYVNFYDNDNTPKLIIDNFITVDKSIDKFTMTSLSFVYNEFNIKWNYNNVTSKYEKEISIKNISQDSFPSKTSDWSTYVSGIDSYNLAKYYWELAKEGYNTNSVINRYPTDRSELKFAYDDDIKLDKTESQVTLTTESIPLTITRYPINTEYITVGYYVDLPYTALGQNMRCKCGDILTINNNNQYCKILLLKDYSWEKKFICLVLSTNYKNVTSIAFNANNCGINIFDGDYIPDVRLSTQYPIDSNDINKHLLTTTGGKFVDFGQTTYLNKSYFTETLTVGTKLRLCQLDFTTDYKKYTINGYVDVTIISSTTDKYECHVDKYNSYNSELKNTWNFTLASSFKLKVFKLVDQSTEVRSNINTYALSYLELICKYATKQKYKVNFKLPITHDTIKYDITNRVMFSDPKITPDVNEYADGYITGLSLDAVNHQLVVELTFNPEWLVSRAPIDKSYIIEDKDNIDLIIEDTTNTNLIIES